MTAGRKQFPHSAAGRGKAKRGSVSVAIANVEPVAGVREVYSLQRLLTNKANPRTRDAAKLGDVLLPWFEKVVAKPGEKLEGVTELWQALVPERMLKRTRLLGLNKGTLSVGVDSAPMRAELDGQLRGGMLRQLQTESRGAVYRVKTCVQAMGVERGRGRGEKGDR
jgi:hypothetical protein